MKYTIVTTLIVLLLGSQSPVLLAADTAGAQQYKQGIELYKKKDTIGAYKKWRQAADLGHVP